MHCATMAELLTNFIPHTKLLIWPLIPTSLARPCATASSPGEMPSHQHFQLIVNRNSPVKEKKMTRFVAQIFWPKLFAAPPLPLEGLGAFTLTLAMID